jgi:hypothetical protein
MPERHSECIFTYILMSVHTPVVISYVLSVQLYTQVYLLVLDIRKTYIDLACVRLRKLSNITRGSYCNCFRYTALYAVEFGTAVR